jgi:MFS family permease
MIARFVPAGFGLLRQRDFRLLWLAHSGSVIGDGFHGVALTWLTFSTLGLGAPGLAAFGIATAAPNLVLGIVSGTLVDRLDRRVVMVLADLVRAAAVAILAVAVALEIAGLATIVVVGLVIATASIFFNPARQAVMPAYVPADRLVAANSVFSISPQVSSLIVPGVAALLFAIVGPVWLLGIDALSFLWSALLIARLTPTPAIPGVAKRRSLLAEAADGLKFIAGHAPTRLVILVAAGNQLFAVGVWRVMIPFWVAAALGGTVVDYGLMLSGFSAGLLVGFTAMASVRRALPLLRIIMLGVFVDGVIVALIAFAPTVALAILAFFALGIANAILNSANSARLQLVPAEMRGRVFASNATLINLTSPVSLAATGALAGPLGPVTIVALSGLGLMGVGALGFLASLRQRDMLTAPVSA